MPCHECALSDNKASIKSWYMLDMCSSRCVLLAAAFLMATVMVSPMPQDLPLCVMHWAILAPELSETCERHASNYASVMQDGMIGERQQMSPSAQAQPPRQLQVGTWLGELSPLVVSQIQSFGDFNLHQHVSSEA